MNHRIILKRLAILEGISFLCFGITVPLKYILGYGLPNLIVGMAHGILFLAYCLWVLIYGIGARKNSTFFILGWFMSLLPFGTFWFDATYLKSQD
jgi:integral membrane protein